jgi:hypothetical protein
MRHFPLPQQLFGQIGVSQVGPPYPILQEHEPSIQFPFDPQVGLHRATEQSSPEKPEEQEQVLVDDWQLLPRLTEQLFGHRDNADDAAGNVSQLEKESPNNCMLVTETLSQTRFGKELVVNL